jgi:hypothetical protein
MNARRYCVVIALTGVAGCVGDLMAADTPILAAPLKLVSASSTISDERVLEENLPRAKEFLYRNNPQTMKERRSPMNAIAGERITWVGEHVGTA